MRADKCGPLESNEQEHKLKQPVVLKVYHGDKLESVKQFNDKQIVIGAEGQIQLALAGEGISPIHAMIEERDDRYFLSDLGSSTGTKLNGQPALEEMLNSGDEIQIGPYRLQFHIGAPKTAAVMPPSAPPPLPKVATPAVPQGEMQMEFDDGDTQSDFQINMEPAAPMLSNPTHAVRPTAPPIPPSRQPRSTGAPEAKEDEPKRSAFVMPTVKKGKTFAPPGKFKDAKEFVKPGKGTSVEVLVVWKDRVLSTNHFNDKKPVFIGGGADADVMVPILSSRSKYQLLKIGTGITVCLAPEMTGEVIRDGGESISISEMARQGKLRNVGGGSEYDLRQGEMIRIGLQNDMISVMVRYKNETPRPMMAPLLDLTASETTGVILAAVISAIFFLYMSLYAPSSLMDDENRVEEPIRKAVVTFNAPKVKEEVKEETPPQPKKVVEVTEKQKSVLAETKNNNHNPQKADSAKSENKPNPGKAAQIAPKDTKNKQNTLTSVKHGGAVKTAPKEGANMKSEKAPTPSLLTAFGSKGMQKNLEKAYGGSGELAGLANQANGYAGQNENRAGDTLGSKLKDTGAGGKGTSTIGMAGGVGTQGRGSGNTGYGTGGLGGKGSTKVDVGGQDATFQGSIDKEAIRRVIQSHKAEIRFCYDQELQRNPGLAGKIAIGWNITETGAVKNAGVASDEMGNRTVANCIVNKLRTWGFPPAPPDVEAHVIFPFVFSSN